MIPLSIGLYFNQWVIKNLRVFKWGTKDLGFGMSDVGLMKGMLSIEFFGCQISLNVP